MESKEPSVDLKDEKQKFHTEGEPLPAELIPLFRLLLKEPTGHDFETCPICKKCCFPQFD